MKLYLKILVTLSSIILFSCAYNQGVIQKDDVSYIKKNSHFYQNVIDQLEKFTSLEVIDGTTSILKIKNIDEIYSDQNEYGGHLSKEGNEIVASLLNKFFNKNIF